MHEIYKSLFSANKEIVKEGLKNIEEIANCEDKSKIDALIDILFKKYDSCDPASIKITIRALNKCLYRGIKKKILEDYGRILLENIVHEDGTIRMIVTSVMNNYRFNLLRIVDFNMGAPIYSKPDLEEIERFYVRYYVELTKLFDSCLDKKIRASVFSSIRRFHCLAFECLIGKTQYYEIYDRFARLELRKKGW